MRKFVAIALLAATTPAAAQIVAGSSRGVVVAHDSVVELHQGSRRIWSAPGPSRASKIVVGDETVAVIDSWNNEVRILSLADGRGRTIATGETPVDGAFIGRDFYLLERDAALVSWFTGAGEPASVRVAADPAYIRESRGMLYVYSRLEGALQEIAPERSGTRVTRRMPVPPFAADMEISGNTAYLLYPRDAKLVAVNLDRFEIRSTVDAGGAPADLAIMSAGSALSAPRIAIADPAAKRLWVTEGAQSVTGAFGRGFLRGLIGLGLFRPSSADFPTGIDRIQSRSGISLAYDSSSGTLYRVKGDHPRRLAENIGPEAFTVAGDRIAIWRDGALRYQD